MTLTEIWDSVDRCDGPRKIRRIRKKLAKKLVTEKPGHLELHELILRWYDQHTTWRIDECD